MHEYVLVLDARNGALDFELFDISSVLTRKAHGRLSGFGRTPRFVAWSSMGQPLDELTWPDGHSMRTHAGALAVLKDWLSIAFPQCLLRAVAHRVMHGGLEHAGPVIADEAVIKALERWGACAPRDQPADLDGLEAGRALFPMALQVACFDTAFHRNKPRETAAFRLPDALYNEGVRRHGYNGLDFEWVSHRLAQVAPDRAAGRVVIVKLDEVIDVCAMRGRRSIATASGFSPLDGLPGMARSGDVDPGALLYLLRVKGMSADEVAELLYARSGVAPPPPLNGTARPAPKEPAPNWLEAVANADKPAGRAVIDALARPIRRAIGALTADIGGLDLLALTGRSAETNAALRAAIIDGLEWLGVELDPVANLRHAQRISTEMSAAPVLTVRGDVPLLMVRHALMLLDGRGAPPANPERGPVRPPRPRRTRPGASPGDLQART